MQPKRNTKRFVYSTVARERVMERKLCRFDMENTGRVLGFFDDG